MAEDESTYTSNRRLNSGSSAFNALSFMAENIVKGMVNTCIPVKVESCTKPGTGGAAGYVSCTPLVMQRGADGNSLTPVELPQLPFMRLQCGNCAIVADPQPGDIGLAVFAQQDCSNVAQGGSSPVQAGSFRCFDMADGFYVGGFLNNAPENWIVFDPEAKDDSPQIAIHATTKIVLDAPQIVLKGALTMESQSGGNTTATMTGTLNATQNVTANGISLNSHTHTCPDGETSGPH